MLDGFLPSTNHVPNVDVTSGDTWDFLRRKQHQTCWNGHVDDLGDVFLGEMLVENGYSMAM